MVEATDEVPSNAAFKSWTQGVRVMEVRLLDTGCQEAGVQENQSLCSWRAVQFHHSDLTMGPDFHLFMEENDRPMSGRIISAQLPKDSWGNLFLTNVISPLFITQGLFITQVKMLDSLLHCPPVFQGWCGESCCYSRQVHFHWHNERMPPESAVCKDPCVLIFNILQYHQDTKSHSIFQTGYISLFLNASDKNITERQQPLIC